MWYSGRTVSPLASAAARCVRSASTIFWSASRPFVAFAPVPTAADLRAARLERTAAALRERLVADLLDTEMIDEESGDGVREMLGGLRSAGLPLAVVTVCWVGPPGSAEPAAGGPAATSPPI